MSADYNNPSQKQRLGSGRGSDGGRDGEQRKCHHCGKEAYIKLIAESWSPMSAKGLRPKNRKSSKRSEQANASVDDDDEELLTLSIEAPE